jgi:hypothetical protein
VIAVRAVPDESTIVTLAFVTTAPLGSVTVPRIAPVCPNAIESVIKNRIQTNSRLKTLLSTAYRREEKKLEGKYIPGVPWTVNYPIRQVKVV